MEIADRPGRDLCLALGFDPSKVQKIEIVATGPYDVRAIVTTPNILDAGVIANLAETITRHRDRIQVETREP